MRRLKLTEFQREQDVALSGDECDAVRRLHPGIRIEPSLGSQGRYDLTPDQRIGLICLPALVIEIRPKVPMSSVVFLVSYGCDAVSWADQYAELAHAPDVVELLAIMLARMVQHATRRGLLNGYQSEDESLQAPRGRLLFDEQIRRRQGIAPPIEVRHDVFTADVLENRLLLSALLLMGRIPHRSEKCRREIFRAQGLLGAVKRLRFAPAAVPGVIFTRLNQHYRPAIALATVLLRSGSLDLGDGGGKGCAFLIDMNDVFERFVRGALRTALRVDTRRLPERAPKIRLDKRGIIPLKPDLCVLNHQRVIWVGDVKYKRLPMAAYLNADLYQLLAYAVALDLPDGTLIYAADEGVAAAEHVVRHSYKQLRVIALDLSAPWRKLLEQINDIARCIPLSVAQ